MAKKRKHRMILLVVLSVAVVAILVPVVALFSIMHPVPTGEIEEGLYAVKDGFSSLFLLEGNAGYMAIDAGMNPEKVRKEMIRLGIDPAEVHSVFFTHTDPDHSGGYQAFPSATYYIPELEEPMVLGQDSRNFFGRPTHGGENPLADEDYVVLETGARFDVDGRGFQTVSTPGHSSGSTSYIVDNRLAFVGDMAVVGRRGLQPLPDFITNVPQEAALTIQRFADQYDSLDLVATSHDGLYVPGE